MELKQHPTTFAAPRGVQVRADQYPCHRKTKYWYPIDGRTLNVRISGWHQDTLTHVITRAADSSQIELGITCEKPLIYESRRSGMATRKLQTGTNILFELVRGLVQMAGKKPVVY